MRFIYILLFLSPLPFASAQPVWQLFWVVFVGMFGLAYTIRWNNLNAAKLPKAFYAPLGATLLLVHLGGVQILMGWSVASENTVKTTLYFLSHIVWFVMIFKSFHQRECVRKFIFVMGVIVTAYCIYGLIVYFSGNEYVLWHEKFVSHESLTSTFVNRNNFSAYVGLGFQSMLAYGLWSYSKNSNSEMSFETRVVQFLRRDIAKVGVITLCLIILLTSLLLTASRGGITSSIIAALCLVCVSLGTASSNEHRKNTKLKLPFMFILTACLSLLFFDLSGDMYEKRMAWGSEHEVRLSIYPLIIDAVMKEPIAGHGLGAFPEVFAQYRTADIHFPIRRGHSDILELYMTGGVFMGTTMVLSFVFLAIHVFRRALRDNKDHIFLLLVITLCLQIGLHSIVDFSLQITAISYLFVALCAAGGYLISKGVQIQ